MVMTTTKEPAIGRARREPAEGGSPEGGAVEAGASVGGAQRAKAEAGMATAEYAIGTVAAAAFAGLLLVILRGDAIRGALEGIISQALSIG